MEIKRFIVGMLETNCYVINFEKTRLIIDPGDEDFKLLDYISKNKKDMTYIYLTHNHFDHIAGVQSVINSIKNYKIILNKYDANTLKNPDYTGEYLMGLELNKSYEIDIAFDEKLDLEIEGYKLEFIRTPGHTKGGSSLIFSNHLFSGDTLFNGGFGRTDLLGGDFSQLGKSIKKYYNYKKDFKIYPGHGDISTLFKQKQFVDCYF